MLNFIFFSLFIHLAIGALLPLLFISQREIGPTFFRFSSGLSVIFFCLALLARPFEALAADSSFTIAKMAITATLSLVTLNIFVLFFGSIFLKQLGKSFLYAAFGLGLVTLVLVSSFYPVSSGLAQPPFWMRALSFVGSSLALGSVLAAMVTGHWYLVNRKLTIQPLRLATLLFLGTIFFRIIFVAALMLYLNFSNESLMSETAQALLKFSGKGMLFWTRVAIGLFGPLVFGLMIYETVRLRSTQSATGILYATVVFVFIGESFSKFIWFFTGIPI